MHRALTDELSGDGGHAELVLEGTRGTLGEHVRTLVRSLLNHARLRGCRRIVWWRMLLRSHRSNTFNDRLNVKLVRDRRPLLTTTADKVAMRDVIEETIGAGHLSDLLAVAESAGDID